MDRKINLFYVSIIEIFKFIGYIFNTSIYIFLFLFIHTKKIRVRIQFIIIYGNKQLLETYLYIVSVIIMYMFIIV